MTDWQDSRTRQAGHQLASEDRAKRALLLPGLKAKLEKAIQDRDRLEYGARYALKADGWAGATYGTDAAKRLELGLLIGDIEAAIASLEKAVAQ